MTRRDLLKILSSERLDYTSRPTFDVSDAADFMKFQLISENLTTRGTSEEEKAMEVMGHLYGD